MINDNYLPVKLIGNGTTTDFSFNWNVLSSAYCRVYLENISSGVQTLQTLGSDYTLDFDESGGTVTFSTAPTNSYYVIIAREITLNQEKAYTTSNGFDGKTVEDSFDKITGAIQDVNALAERAVVLPLGSALTGTLELPPPSAGKALIWNDDADGLTNSTNTFDDIVTDATAQAVIATTQAGLASGAAVNAATSETNAQGYSSIASTAKDDALLAQTAAESARDLAQGYAAAADVAKIEWQGAWAAGSYNEHDAVEHNGTSYIATTTTTEEPSISATDWDVLALKGTDGTGSGDVSSSISSSTDGSLVVFDGVGGKTVKQQAIGAAGTVLKSNGTTPIYDDPIPIAAAGGTVDAITATFTTGVVTLTDKMQVRVIASGANTGAMTFSPNALTVHNVTKYGGTATAAGDVKAAGHVLDLVYDATNTRWEFMNPAVSGATGTLKHIARVSKTDTFSTTSTSFTSVTGLSYSLTPSAVGKVYKITANLAIASGGSNTNGAYVALDVNGALLDVGDAAGTRTQCSSVAISTASFWMGNITVIAYYTASGTSPVTVSVKIKTDSASYAANINRSHQDADIADKPRGSSYLIIEEIQ